MPYPLATAEDLANAKATIESYGVQCLAIQGDVRDGDLLKESANQTVNEFGSLDFMIANAGITQIGTLDLFSQDQLSLVMEINLGGVMKTVQAAIPIMQAQNSGRMVLTASITGRSGSPLFPVYSATKWGVIGLTKSIALQMGPHNVTVNAIAPSFVDTKLLNNDYIIGAMGMGVGNPNATWEEISAAVAQTLHALPVGAFDAVHVANTVRFLCSDAAALVSGDVFDISAGANANFNA